MKLKIWIDEGRYKNIFRRGLYKTKRILRCLYLQTPYRQRQAKIIHSHKAIYFDIPKAATTSIFHLIYQQIYDKDCDDYYEIYRKFPQVKEIDLNKNWFKEYYKFTFVRNPYARTASCYADLILKQKVREIIEALGITENASFKEFVVAVSKKSDEELGKLDPHLLPQYISLYKDGKLLVDYVGKVENINEEINIIFKKIGLKEIREVPCLNKSIEDKRYKEYYNEETIKLVKKRFKKDLDLFNYKY